MRVGVLRGRENSFPEAVIAKVNSMDKGVTAEFIQLGGTKLNETVPYRVVLDRMSHEVPYYEVYLKMAALQGTYCINNPFWRTADDKFFGYAAAEHLGIHEPKTVLLPNYQYVEDVTDESLRNLWPTDFAMYLDYVGLPCIMKPAHGGGWKDVNKLNSLEELLFHYDHSGLLTMIAQEFIQWDEFVRCICLGQDVIRPIKYDPKARRYHPELDFLPPATLQRVVDDSRTLVQALGYDMDSMEWAIKDGVPYAIDFMNPAPDMDIYSLTPVHFEWVVKAMADLAIRLAHEPAEPKPSWERFLQGRAPAPAKAARPRAPRKPTVRKKS